MSVHSTLVADHAMVETLWVGGEGGMEARLVERAGIPYRSIPAAGVHGVSLHQLPSNLIRLARGYRAARRILRDYRPDVLFFTGGYVAVPMAVAGARLPSVAYVPDIEPGLALRICGRLADQIAVTAEDSYRYVRRPGHMVLTGYPTRPELAAWTRPQARRALHLNSDRPVLLVAGGSKGSHSLNQAVLACLPELLKLAQVVHLTGDQDWPEVEQQAKNLDTAQSERYQVHAFLHEEMGAALAAADLVVSRAGASILGEYPLFGLPSILVPYPFAWRYQKVNADYLVSHGAAVLLEDGQLSAGLLRCVSDLLGSPENLAVMRDRVRGLHHPRAAADIGQLLLDQARGWS
jgi:UDP-N-acetylglucosamine--N-acetylmuramyl-(pentapeptide) pyrophosphoryl-undecaprenol N-acetylglucosamine transferase